MRQFSTQPTKPQRASQAMLAEARRLLAAGALDQAERHFQRAVARDQSSPGAIAHLAEFYFNQHRPHQALPFFMRMTTLQPNNAIAWRNRGVSAASVGDHQQAVSAFRRAVELKPDYATAHHALALSLMTLGRPRDALPAFQTAINLNPQDHEALYNLANALESLGELNAAEVAFRLAITLRPDFADAHCNLGKLHFIRNEAGLAKVHLTQAVALAPGSAIAHTNLGAIHQHQGDLGQALACHQSAIALQPDFAEALSNISSVHLALGNVEAATATYRQSLAVKPDNAAIFSDLLLCLQNDHHISNEQLFDEHRQFAAQFEAPLRSTWPQHTNECDAHRRLRVGYVSGDLRNHAVTFFLEPLLAHHDRSKFELHVYSNHAQRDAVTQRLASYVDKWSNVHHLSDDDCAKKIHEDQIDILVDLSGHTAHNRLLTFARKPAPVQVTYIGYGGTTGLDAMDYRITDRWLDPIGATDCFHTEKLIRLPTGGAAFQPCAEAPDVAPLPALSGNGVMLACLNNPRKIRPPVVALWSRILVARGDATLTLGSTSDESMKAALLDQFAQAGVDASRIIFQPWMPIEDYLALHGRIDLALDPFPYNGGTTSCHSLWMGVPFVTLAGDRTMSRVGACLLASVGLDDWIADGEAAYVTKVLTALDDLPELNRVRQSLRGRFDPPAGAPRSARVTTALETAYRGMWHTWCKHRREQ